ncbi:MAG: dihydrofolate reductase [Myxococcales bacterium]|nr:dihydrofolate reductase [Myxococcales bacterium]MBL0196773.1 dihydrofolate reductase [Myxococcales bacterium]HQY60540.1 dihydrofolate reductase [Polyangiaceae bacterium]
MRPLALVACVANAGAIGLKGGMPWHIPEDLRHFRNVTLGHAVVMGRRTHASIGRPLPGRRNIIVSRDRALEAPGCETATSLDQALALAWEGDDEPRVIGGAAIYRDALPRVTRVFLTRLHRDVEADVFFPLEGLAGFHETERVAGETDGVEFVTFQREAPAR